MAANFQKTAHAINEQPWDPPPGKRKLRCENCWFLFATSDHKPLCHDCRRLGNNGGWSEGRPRDSKTVSPVNAGDVYWSWTVVEYVGSHPHSGRQWRVRCACGTEGIKTTADLRYGKSKSCRGCSGR